MSGPPRVLLRKVGGGEPRLPYEKDWRRRRDAQIASLARSRGAPAFSLRGTLISLDMDDGGERLHVACVMPHMADL
jgi:hypothetical protein